MQHMELCLQHRSRRCCRKGNYRHILQAIRRMQTEVFRREGGHRRNRFFGGSMMRTRFNHLAPSRLAFNAKGAYLSEVDFIENHLIRMGDAVKASYESSDGEDDKS